MIKKWFSQFLIVLVPALLCATSMEEMEAQVDELCAALTEIEGRAYPELEIYDLLQRIVASKDAMGDLVQLSNVDATRVDASLAPYFEAYAPLYIALTEPLSVYGKALNAYKKTDPARPFLKLADISDIVTTCEDCSVKCSACNGTKKCSTCKGRGYTIEKSSGSSLSLSASKRLKCTTCASSGRCKTCSQRPDLCTTCNGIRKVVDEEALYDRIQNLVHQLSEQSAIVFENEINARKQTQRLADEIRKINSSTFSNTDPEKVLEVLDALPTECQSATTWSYVPPLREVAEAMLAEKTHNAPEKVRMRAEIEQAINDAQSAKTAEEALERLITPMDRCQTSERYELLETTQQGFVKQWQREREAMVETLKEKLTKANEIEDAKERFYALEDFLEDCKLPEVARRLKAETALYEQLKSTDEAMKIAVKQLQEEATTLMANAEAAIEALKAKAIAAENQGTPWWIWAAIIGGILIVGYFAFSIVQMVGEHKAKVAKEAQRKAALDSIRNTFARRKHH